MDFFDAQEVARKKTKVLVFYFVLAILGIVLAVYALLLALAGLNGEGEELLLWQPGLLLAAGVGSLAVILLGSGYKVMQLSAGGSRVALELGGRRVDSDTTDPDERRLLNVVEEMAIASGTPVPDVYVLEGEESINAFAAGYSPSDAVIGVTRGCMRLLSRDELQGVIAHEFSHVLNGDMRLNIRLMGLLFGIVMLTILGRIVLRAGAHGSSGNRKNNSAGAILLFGAGLIVIGSIGVFFARLIQAAVSRQREFLADASAVQFTRLPDGIAGALKKIGGLSSGSRLQDPHAEEASHMFFADGMNRLASALATHPPLPVRIRALEPRWDGKFLPVDPEGSGRREDTAAARRPAMQPGRMAAFAGASEGSAPATRTEPVVPAFREPNEAQIAQAAALHAQLPQPWVERVRQTSGAEGVLLGLLLSRQPDLRSRQLAQLEGLLEEPLRETALAAHEALASLPSQEKLALVDLALPALRRLSLHRYKQFIQLLRLVVECDQRVGLFEFTLEKVLQRHLDLYFHRRPQPGVRFTRLGEVTGPIGVLLSALARVGARGDGAAEQQAFAAGLSILQRHEPRLALRLLPQEECGLGPVGRALDALDQAGPLVKRTLIEALGQVALADARVVDQEAELVRAIADSLGVPLPVRLQPPNASVEPPGAQSPAQV